ncbi:MAG: hypothetical protein KA807_07870 [Prolixibacteraceae bacterium]|nr:hypothetical protein [Prolixibacteraceae bacterium]
MDKLRKLSKSRLFEEILKDPDRKPILKIIGEVLSLTWINRELPFHYFSRYLFKKDATDIKNYMPNKLAGRIVSSFNDQTIKHVLDNKLYFDLFYRQFGINLPRVIMYNHNKLFIIEKESININNFDEFRSLIEKVFEQNPSYDSIFIKKIYSSSGGRSILKLFRNQISADFENLHKLFSEVINSEYLFQETIKQHSELNKLNSSCLNTIRIDTFIDSDGKIDVISAFIRMSIDNSHVDNISRGGCKVGIDLKTGKLKKIGYPELHSFGVKVLTEHPLTGVKFDNFRIPFFTQVLELVLQVASYMPKLRLVGWDVAIAESGPILIEGNSDYVISGNDLTEGGYLANSVFKKVIREIDYR